jgi:hypothetical protein
MAIRCGTVAGASKHGGKQNTNPRRPPGIRRGSTKWIRQWRRLSSPQQTGEIDRQGNAQNNGCYKAAGPDVHDILDPPFIGLHPSIDKRNEVPNSAKDEAYKTRDPQARLPVLEHLDDHQNEADEFCYPQKRM